VRQAAHQRPAATADTGAIAAGPTRQAAQTLGAGCSPLSATTTVLGVLATVATIVAIGRD
jgi:hypothetical protein